MLEDWPKLYCYLKLRLRETSNAFDACRQEEVIWAGDADTKPWVWKRKDDDIKLCINQTYMKP